MEAETEELEFVDAFIVTCEHGGNRIPPGYRPFFEGSGALLRTHRGYDIGALRLARELAATLDAPLVVCTTSRLLIDLNRSCGHPRLYSEMTRPLPATLRDEILARYYLPYRNEAENLIARHIERGMRVIHLSSHSFTPELGGKVRDADIGLLYDPACLPETALCRRWREALKATMPELKVRMNYPYAGTADGFTVHLRRRFPAQRYLGIELEVNQKHAQGSASHWRTIRQGIVQALQTAMPAAWRTPNIPAHYEGSSVFAMRAAEPGRER